MITCVKLVPFNQKEHKALLENFITEIIYIIILLEHNVKSSRLSLDHYRVSVPEESLSSHQIYTCLKHKSHSHWFL